MCTDVAKEMVIKRKQRKYLELGTLKSERIEGIKVKAKISPPNIKKWNYGIIIFLIPIVIVSLLLDDTV